MRRFHTFLLSILLALGALSATAADISPRIVFPAGQDWPSPADGMITVEGPLLQFELHPGQVISATRATRFSLAKNGSESDAVELNVVQGAVTWVDLDANAISHLPPGRYVLAPAGPGVKVLDATAGRAMIPREETETLAPGYKLADSIMTQQQKYLDTLKVDVRDLNHFLASIIRGLVPRRP